eukprot:Skav201427  [mRNA]  locus=scaffold201:198727:205020:+ [translate_table: standard]
MRKLETRTKISTPVQKLISPAAFIVSAQRKGMQQKERAQMCMSSKQLKAPWRKPSTSTSGFGNSGITGVDQSLVYNQPSSAIKAT